MSFQSQKTSSVLHATSWTLIHVILFSCVPVTVKMLSQYVPVSGQIFFRSAATVAIILISTKGNVIFLYFLIQNTCYFLGGTWLYRSLWCILCIHSNTNRYFHDDHWNDTIICYVIWIRVSEGTYKA